MIKKLLFYVVLFLLPFMVLSQSLGDYKSNVTTGNWTTLSSWQYYNGTAWVTPSGTSPQGYPGQFAGTGIVTILDNQTITISSSTPNTFGVLIVGADIDVKTLNVTISASALVKFSGNNFIRFPEYTSIKINSPGKFDDGGTCNNNVAVYIGTIKFAVCKGAGNSEFTFDQVNQGGGTILANPNSNTPICQNGTINLFGNISGTVGTTTSNGSISGVNYSWSIKAPDNTISIFSTLNPSFIASQSGTYMATINYSTYYGSNLYSNSKTILITVNALPATPTITAGNSTTFCTGGSVTLTSSAGTSYVWSTGATTQSISATTAGNYIVKVTNANGCQSASSAPTVVTVNSAPTITTQPLSQLDCEGSLVNFKVIATGTNLSYVWKYKRPTDLAFITLTGTETNTTYPNTPIYNEISLANVGSAQYPNGTYFQVVVSNGTCSVTSNLVVLSVNEIVAINSPTLTPAQSVNDVKLCSGSNYSYTAVVSNPSNGPVTYQWKSQIPSGSWNNVVDGPHFSGATTSTLNIINGTPAESGKYRVDVVYNRTGGNCSVSSFAKVRLLTFYPLLTTPNTAISQPDCSINTGTITVTVQNVSDTYSFDNGLSYQASNVKSGLAVGPYNIFIKNIGGCVSPVKNSSIIAAPAAAIWNGSGWTNGPPTNTQALIFNGTYTSIGDIVACSCQVNSGNVTINSGHTLKITNGVTVSSGSLNFNNNASLVQINNSATNIGNINYNRITPAIINTDYVYWSSPVFGYTLGAVSPNTLAGKMYSYDAFASPEDWRQESSGTVMAPGKGYIVRGPEYAPPLPPFPSPFSTTFVGVPNNGTIIIPIGGVNTSNLIGNPYPSALDADLFLSANSAVLEGTIYFWTHNTAIQLASDIIDGSAGSGAYAYTSNDYASYNFTGGVGVGTPATTLGFNTSSIPSGKITSGQSFFATSIASGQVATFNNGMRVDVLGVKLDNSQFFKNASNSKSAEVVEKNRVWLNLTNTLGAFKQTLLGYVSGATNDYDNGYDGESYDGNEYLDFYSINNDRNLVIQGRTLPFDEDDTIPLGYRSSISGDFTISIDQVDGLFVGKAVYLKDNVTNNFHDLNESAYNFKTETGTFNDRFVLSYTHKILVTDDFNVIEKGVLVSNKNKEVKINSSVENINTVVIYDLLGRQIYKKANVNNKELIILNLLSAKQTVLIKVSLQGGEVINKKMIN